MNSFDRLAMLDDQWLAAFSETVKLASPDLTGLVGRLAPRLKNMGALGGIGAAAGAAGAGIGTAAGEYRKARSEGASRSAAAGKALGSGLVHAGRGALIGGALGAGAGAVAKRDWSQAAQLDGLLGAPARFGIRQVHGLTGVLRPEELEAVRGGAHGARQAFLGAARGLGAGTTSARQFSRAGAALDAAERAQNLGLTSVPGYLRAAANKDVGLRQALGASIKQQATGQPSALTALAVLPPTVGLGSALLSKDERDAQGRGRAERALGNAADLAGGIVTGSMPFGAGQLVATGMRRAGSGVGRGIDRLRTRGGQGSPLAPPPPEATAGEHVPTERVTSPAAGGRPLDVGS